jgi:hypothetical protein
MSAQRHKCGMKTIQVKNNRLLAMMTMKERKQIIIIVINHLYKDIYSYEPEKGMCLGYIIMQLLCDYVIW